jgi:hypothetical protein
MTQSYLYSINKAINIDNSTNTHHTIFSANSENVYLNINDSTISDQVRVIGGLWSDDQITRSIKSHQDNYGLGNGLIDIGRTDDKITVNSCNVSIGTESLSNSRAKMVAKAIDIGENDTISTFVGSNITVGNSDVSLISNDGSKSLSLGTSSTSTLNITGNTSINTASVKKDEITPIFSVNPSSTSGTFVVNDSSNTITVGGTTTSNLNMSGIATLLTATDKAEINTSSDGAYLLMDETNNSVQMGSATTTNATLKGHATVVNATASAKVETPIFEVQKTGDNVFFQMLNQSGNVKLASSQKTFMDTPLFEIQEASDFVFFKMDNNNKLIQLGVAGTDNVNVNGVNTTITNSTKTFIDTPLFEIQEVTDKVFFQMNNAGSGTIQLGLSGTSSTTLEGNTVNVKGTANAKITTPLLEMNTSSDVSYMKVDHANSTIQFGGSSNGNLIMNGANTTLNAITYSKTNTALFEVNTTSAGGYLKVDNTLGSEAIQLGSTNGSGTPITKNLDMDAVSVTINAPTSLETTTDVLTHNSSSTKTMIEVNDTENRIIIGGEDLQDTRIRGKNVIIGEVGQTTTIYGNLIAYSEGSNVITNTVTQETAAFHVHNTGTQPALTVIQDNSIGTSEDLALFVTSSNQDRAPLRIDGDGRVGLGLPRLDGAGTYDLKAWLHVNRNDPDNSGNNDIMMIEDTDNDTTPFIIKNNGRIGVGTTDPKYKLDIFNDDVNTRGVAVRDAFYIKTNEMNKIFYSLGNCKYTGTDVDSVCEAGFDISWNNTSAIFSDIDIDSYMFRISCRFHVAKKTNDLAYRRFEIFVNPKADSANSLPGEVTIVETYDSTSSNFTILSSEVVRVNDTTARLKVTWKNKDTTNTTTRAFMDLDVFAHQEIGDLTFVRHAALTSGSAGTVST